MITFRDAMRGDVPRICALMSDDVLGRTREGHEMRRYLDAFDRIAEEPQNHLIVGEMDARIVATYQITFISGLSLGATRRAQVETVRVATDLRGRGIGREMFADAEARAREAGCGLLQLTMNRTRADAHRFYEGLGFAATHTGFKKTL
ncbi:GNAT family N-acetyltransferase [Roseovarius sp. SCSIO 43702]|uniref:GNAT family N-acetyltransferase n=1 Tax=Roseovarius sp. SCSIO 43702 TaxID=2823043 RepID=UPI001C736A3A|nr:GNAT family N-acetyltransferase [Roseovarius sp. SCSIO 43702]QYX55787.1 GNAT family N-acetyltransferase [Roseovarius sp. SCSIO 43702]